MFKLIRAHFSGSADLIEQDDDQTLEVVKEAVQRSPHLQRMMRINMLSAFTIECPEERRPFMRKFYRRGVNRFFHQMFEVELPEWQEKSNG